jgi:hypothetical protein
VILALLSGMWIPPRWSLDFCEPFKIKEIDREKDNYFEKSVMVFNRYKTAKSYGVQSVKVPAGLSAILTKWIQINPTDTLLFDVSGNPMTIVKLNQRLHKIFGGNKVAVNMLRHIFITEKYKNIPELSDMVQTAKDMGHEVFTAMQYVKK